MLFLISLYMHRIDLVIYVLRNERVFSLYQDRFVRYHFKIIHSYRHLYYLSSSVFIINDKKNAFHSKMDFIAFINIMNSSFFQSKSCV